jgi:hypothetical protein
VGKGSINREPLFPADDFRRFLAMAPRRCDTFKCAPNGECLQCGAATGEGCFRPNFSTKKEH